MHSKSLGLELTVKLLEKVGIEVEGMTHVAESTNLVALVHTEGATELIDLGIVSVEGIDKRVKVFLCLIVLLHLAEGEGTLLVGCHVGWVGGNGLRGLDDGFDGRHRIEELKN